MRITTSLLPTAPDSDDAVDIAVVIDVLRATSVMATALDAGATEVITCRDVSLAREILNDQQPQALLCGERNCVAIPGFDLGNSPAEYTPAIVGGRTLILTTTNGTAAIETATSAAVIVAASFLNLSAIVDSIAGSDSVNLICAGTDGCVSNEDVLLAGLILTRCESRYQATIEGDSSVLARRLWHSYFRASEHADAETITNALRETRGGRNLVRVGFQNDIELCSKLDAVSVVPRIHGRNPISFRRISTQKNS